MFHRQQLSASEKPSLFQKRKTTMSYSQLLRQKEQQSLEEQEIHDRQKEQKQIARISDFFKGKNSPNKAAMEQVTAKNKRPEAQHQSEIHLQDSQTDNQFEQLGKIYKQSQRGNGGTLNDRKAGNGEEVDEEEQRNKMMAAMEMMGSAVKGGAKDGYFLQRGNLKNQRIASSHPTDSIDLDRLRHLVKNSKMGANSYHESMKRGHEGIGLLESDENKNPSSPSAEPTLQERKQVINMNLFRESARQQQREFHQQNHEYLRMFSIIATSATMDKFKINPITHEQKGGLIKGTNKTYKTAQYFSTVHLQLFTEFTSSLINYKFPIKDTYNIVPYKKESIEFESRQFLDPLYEFYVFQNSNEKIEQVKSNLNEVSQEGLKSEFKSTVIRAIGNLDYFEYLDLINSGSANSAANKNTAGGEGNKVANSGGLGVGVEKTLSEGGNSRDNNRNDRNVTINDEIGQSGGKSETTQKQSKKLKNPNNKNSQKSPPSSLAIEYPKQVLDIAHGTETFEITSDEQEFYSKRPILIDEVETDERMVSCEEQDLFESEPSVYFEMIEEYTLFKRYRQVEFRNMKIYDKDISINTDIRNIISSEKIYLIELIKEIDLYIELSAQKVNIEIMSEISSQLRRKSEEYVKLLCYYTESGILKQYNIENYHEKIIEFISKSIKYDKEYKQPDRALLQEYPILRIWYEIPEVIFGYTREFLHEKYYELVKAFARYNQKIDSLKLESELRVRKPGVKYPI